MHACRQTCSGHVSITRGSTRHVRQAPRAIVRLAPLFVWVGGLLFLSPLSYRASMPPLAVAANVGNGSAAAVPPARTRFVIEPGTPNNKVEDAFQLPSSSPIISAWPFINWVVDNVAQVCSAPRSVVGNPILLASRRPTSAEQTKLDGLSMLTHELDHDESSTWMHELDKVKAFDKIYSTLGDWKAELPSLKAKVAQPARMVLSSNSFAASAAFVRGRESHLSFLHATSIGALIRAHDLEPDAQFMPTALARACSLLGSKDNPIERQADDSTVSLSARMLASRIKRMLNDTDPTDAEMADKFVTAVAELKLPSPFCMHACTSSLTKKEFELAFDFAHGTASELRQIEISSILRAPQVHKSLKPIIGRFAHPRRGLRSDRAADS